MTMRTPPPPSTPRPRDPAWDTTETPAEKYGRLAHELRVAAATTTNYSAAVSLVQAASTLEYLARGVDQSA